MRTVMIASAYREETWENPSHLTVQNDAAKAMSFNPQARRRAMNFKDRHMAFASDFFAPIVDDPSSPRDIEPLVTRTIQFLEKSPNGASRRDILSAIRLQPSAWSSLREALERHDMVICRGRGPGLRHVHVKWVAPDELERIREDGSIEEARQAICELFQIMPNIDSRTAQQETGLDVLTLRRVLKDLIATGHVMRHGQRRSTRYQWVGQPAVAQTG